MKSDVETLNLLYTKHKIDVKEIAPKNTREYENLIKYIKAMRDQGMNPEFIAEHLAYNYNNYSSLTRLESKKPIQNKEGSETLLHEVVEQSKNISANEKLKISKLILSKITDFNKITASFEKHLIETIEIQAIEADNAWSIEGSSMTPADLAMFYLFQMAEVSRALQDMPTHMIVTSAMSSLLEVSPAGSLSETSLMLPLKAMSNGYPCADDVAYEEDEENEGDEITKNTDNNFSIEDQSFSEVIKATALLTEKEIEEYGEDTIRVIRRSCSDIFSMKITCDDDLGSTLGTLTEDEIADFGNDLIEIIRIIAELVRVRLGGVSLSENKCKAITIDIVDDYGAEFINVVTKTAYEESGVPQKYKPLQLI